MRLCPRQCRAGHVKPPGFTLVELMVVIVLVGIASAMILPEMQGTYDDAQLRSSGRKLASAIALASSRAVAINRPHCLRIDPKTGKYTVERPGRAADDDGGSLVPVRDIPGGEGQLDSRITVQIRRNGEAGSASDPTPPEPAASEAETTAESTGKGEAILFKPDCTAEPAEIILTDLQGFRLALRLNPVTSRVRIVDLGRE